MVRVQERPPLPPGAWGRSSAGRASPLQGEGQEFESPRLHQHAGAQHPWQQSPDPCPSIAEGHRPADRWGPRGPSSAFERGAPYQLEYVIGRNRSLFDLRFRRVVRRIPIERLPQVRDHWVRTLRGSSYTGHEVDALAPRADEGRGRLRKAPGSREQTSIRRCPNGETRLEKSSSPLVESNRPGGGKPAN